LNYIQATRAHADDIYQLVQDTVTQIYPKYYSKEIVDFFCQLHNQKNILKDIERGTVGMLMVDDRIIGTGSYDRNHITRVYVSPAFQRQGYGSYIMQVLEDQIAPEYDTIYLDASLPAKHMYEKRGYVTQKQESMEVEQGAVLNYDVMQKVLL